MSYARSGNVLYMHGRQAGRIMQVLASGGPVCIEVTLVDGIVLGPDATGHSVNYRSVVAFGTGREVTDGQEKATALEAIMEHHIPGRLNDIPGMTDREIAATAVIAVTLEDASAKIRSGSPGRVPETGNQQPWCGELPLRLTAMEPRPAGDPATQPLLPGYVKDYRRGSASAI
jgi:nitroimidazol reductase NimA-like FMN-containing flavoprotein (pyridoxamine 5'-phosphate oxidase superfamily)